MALIPDKVIWITDKQGVVLEEYQGKFSIKAVQRYTSQGQEKVSYDWVRKEVYNKDTKTREIPSKVNAAMGAFLGDKDQAVKALASLLQELGVAPSIKPVQESEGVPF